MADIKSRMATVRAQFKQQRWALTREQATAQVKAFEQAAEIFNAILMTLRGGLWP